VKKGLALIVAILFAFSMTAVSFAAEKPAAAPAPAEKKAAAPAEKKEAAPAKAEKKAPAKKHQVTGEVAAVDAAANSITVKGKKGDVVISADAKMLADVKVGDKVVAKYEEKDGKNVAKSVKKAAKKAEKKAEPKKEEPKKAEPKKAEPAPAPKPAEPAKK